MSIRAKKGFGNCPFTVLVLQLNQMFKLNLNL